MSESDESVEQRRERHRQAGVAKGESLTHSGALDLMSAAVVVAGFFFLPDVYTNADAAALQLGRVLLGVATTVLLLRGLVRLGTYFNT